MNLKLHDYLWIFPFISFLFGYYALSWFFYTPSIPTPVLIGKHIDYAIKALSSHNLNVRIIGDKEDNDLPDGTILSQSPSPKSKIKPNHTVFCVVSRQKELGYAPLLIGKKIDYIDELLKKEHIRHETYKIPCQYPDGYCIAQLPAAQQPLKQRAMITYIASNVRKEVILPNMKGKLVSDIIGFLTAYGITPTIFHKIPVEKNHQCTNCRIIEQKPLPGSLINLSKPIHIQLQVR